MYLKWTGPEPVHHGGARVKQDPCGDSGQGQGQAHAAAALEAT